MSLLRELDIKDHEPRVINQLLEFTYREFIDNTRLTVRLYNHPVPNIFFQDT